MTISFLENWHSLYLLQISSESLKPFYRSLQISVLTVKRQPSAWLHFYPRLLLFHPQLTSQDHTPQVIRRALEKHNMEDFSCHDFSLCQTLKCGKGSLSRVNLHTNIDLTKREKNSIFFPPFIYVFSFHSSELQIPDKANVFYAMCTSSNYDFVLRQRWRSHRRCFGSSSSPGDAARNLFAKWKMPMHVEYQDSAEQLICISRTIEFRYRRQDSLSWNLTSPRGQKCRDGEI